VRRRHPHPQNPAIWGRYGPWHGGCCLVRRKDGTRESGINGPEHGREDHMYNIFYIVGVVVVVLAILGYFGFR
jgi:hypothetical protein